MMCPGIADSLHWAKQTLSLVPLLAVQEQGLCDLLTFPKIVEKWVWLSREGLFLAQTYQGIGLTEQGKQGFSSLSQTLLLVIAEELFCLSREPWLPWLRRGTPRFPRLPLLWGKNRQVLQGLKGHSSPKSTCLGWQESTSSSGRMQ